MKYLVNRVDLGKRTMGYEIYVGETKEFIGLTSKQIKDGIGVGIAVKGFVLNADGDLVLDSEGFKTNNIMVKTGIGSLNPLHKTDCVASAFYVVVRVCKEPQGTVYEVVNSRYGRTEITEAKLKALLELGAIQGGAYLDHKGKVVVCDGVEIVEAAE